MPFKFNATRRHRIPKARYRVRNWPAYEAGLRRRGDLTLWIDEAAVAGWQAPRRSTPGGQAIYSDLAIEMVLMLRMVFHLALRQAEAFAGSVLRLLGLDLCVPDHTTLSRRSGDFARRRPNVISHGARHLIVDSTGLKLFGQGEWDEEKHGRTRRSWRKLHLAIDAGSGEIVANALTDNGADDVGEVPGLLEQFEGEVASVIADGAYDGEPVYRTVARKQHDPPPNVVIPPRAAAVLSTDAVAPQSQRDKHIQLIAEKGRMGWQKATGYGRRSLVETAIGRYKHLIGSKLRALGLAAQQGEVAIAVEALNRMIRVAKPLSVRVT
jgi:Transposase DDE domain